MPRKTRSNKIPKNPEERPQFNYEDEKFLAKVDMYAFEGYYDFEIADELQISRYAFAKAMERHKILRQTLEDARARAKEHSSESGIPSVAKFRAVWATCNGQRTKLLKAFGIGWTKLQSWLVEEPAFVDIIAERDLEFLEQADIAGRILSLGSVKGKDKFPGWERYPDTWMMRFYMNTLGKRYGYGENPVLPTSEDFDIPDKLEQGVDIESWIRQEVSQKKDDGK